MKFEPCWSWEIVCSYSAADAGANLEFGSREGQQLARSGSTPSVRNGAENGQRFMDRHKKRPPDRAAFRFDQFRELSLRLQQNLVSRSSG
jgi:hypothetical protein